jgi:2',3'-cyclic-nucleotide 2'-phosphodiesterase (5'-nucleotidase family)
MNRTTACALPLFALLAACSVSLTIGDPPGNLTLLHLNDTYRIDAVEDGERGGFGRVVTLIRQLRDEGRDVRMLHGGDFLYPSLESQLWDGEQMIEVMNFMHDLAPMYVVAGNHEFDPRTPGPLARSVKQSRFEWLGDNFSFNTGDAAVDARLRNAYVTEMDGIRIGFLALTLHEEDGGNLRDYAPVDRNYVTEAKRVLAALEAEGVELIIGLTHLNLDEDRQIAALRKQYPAFKIIAGGHEHEPEFEAGNAERATIVKGASNARTIWRLDIWRDDEGEVQVNQATVAIDAQIESDADYSVIERKWRSRLLARIPFLEATLGMAAVPLDGRETAVRNEESNWGVFIADQMRGAFRGPPAELAFVNGGTLRIDDFIADEITFEDVGRTFGFSSYLRRMTMTGADFRALLEAGYRGAGPSKGYFPQVSGFRVCVDRRLPEGRRIVSLQVPVANGWQEIEPGRNYSLVAPDYLYGGGDGYDFSAATNVSLAGSELKYLVVDGIVRAQAEGRTVGGPSDPQNPRIVILNDKRSVCWPD